MNLQDLIKTGESKIQIDTPFQIKIMNLQDLIKTGESNTVEFKEKFDERTIESAVAFIQKEVE
jgi:hypothetical protein